MNAMIATVLWLSVIGSLIYFVFVRIGLRLHGRGRDKNIFGTTASKVDKQWKAWFALAIVLMVVSHGWWYLLHPFRQMLGG